MPLERKERRKFLNWQLYVHFGIFTNNGISFFVTFRVVAAVVRTMFFCSRTCEIIVTSHPNSFISFSIFLLWFFLSQSRCCDYHFKFPEQFNNISDLCVCVRMMQIIDGQVCDKFFLNHLDRRDWGYFPEKMPRTYWHIRTLEHEPLRQHRHPNLSRINCLQFQFDPIHWFYSSSFFVFVIDSWDFVVRGSCWFRAKIRWIYFHEKRFYAIIIFQFSGRRCLLFEFDIYAFRIRCRLVFLLFVRCTQKELRKYPHAWSNQANESIWDIIRWLKMLNGDFGLETMALTTAATITTKSTFIKIWSCRRL